MVKGVVDVEDGFLDVDPAPRILDVGATPRVLDVGSHTQISKPGRQTQSVDEKEVVVQEAFEKKPEKAVTATPTAEAKANPRTCSHSRPNTRP